MTWELHCFSNFWMLLAEFLGKLEHGTNGFQCLLIPGLELMTSLANQKKIKIN